MCTPTIPNDSQIYDLIYFRRHSTCMILKYYIYIHDDSHIYDSVAVCCSVQCVAVCCSVLQCVAVCCSALQCVAVCCSVLQCVARI